MKFFTSDIHFADTETMVHDDRPFKTIDEYDNYTIKMWNKMMGKDDTLYVVGDLFDCNRESLVWMKPLNYIRKIKASVVLIIGNNEDRIIKYFFNGNDETFRELCLSYGIKDVRRDMELSFGGVDFYLTHEPINHKKKFVNLVGHLHRSRGLWYSFGLNVACDLNHFRPYSEKDILFQLSEKEKYFKDKNFKLL